MSQFQNITAENFESEVLQSPLPVLVDLYADWCGPCRLMSQVLDRLSPQLKGRAKVVKINTDEQPELAAAFRVSSIPMLVLMHNGKAVNASVGLVRQEQILQMVEQVAPVAAQT